MRGVDEEGGVDEDDAEAPEGGGRADHSAPGNSFLASIRNSFFLAAINFFMPVLDKMFHINCNTLEHSCIIQNASYFVSNCVSICHNIVGFSFSSWHCTLRIGVWSVAGSLRPHTFLPLKSGVIVVVRSRTSVSSGFCKGEE